MAKKRNCFPIDGPRADGIVWAPRRAAAARSLSPQPRIQVGQARVSELERSVHRKRKRQTPRAEGGQGTTLSHDTRLKWVKSHGSWQQLCSCALALVRAREAQGAKETKLAASHDGNREQQKGYFPEARYEYPDGSTRIVPVGVYTDDEFIERTMQEHRNV